jgi:hypothetical protein
MTILDSRKSLVSLYVILERHAPVAIRSDRSIMVEACMHDITILRLVDITLNQKQDFVEAVLAANPRGIEFLAQEAQLLFPELVARSFDPRFVEIESNPSHAAKLELYVGLFTKLSPDIWTNRDVVKAWFLAGGPFLGDRFSTDWKCDKEIFWWIAKGRDLGYCGHSFQKHATADILGDKEFMLQVVGCNHSLFQYASPQLHLDFDLAVLFFARAGSKRASSHFWIN